MDIIPDPAESYVREFCWKVSKHEPVIVPFRPLLGKPPNECFVIVPEHVAACGGKQHLGWSVFQFPGVMIEAEFHCVWENPEGELIDISPKKGQFDSDRILFIPDPKKPYRGVQVDNIRKPLTRDYYLLEFIRLKKALFRELNKRDLRNKYGKIEPTHRQIKISNRIEQLEVKIFSKFGPASKGSSD